MLRGNHACLSKTLIKITYDTKSGKRRKMGVNREGRPETSQNIHTLSIASSNIVVVGEYVLYGRGSKSRIIRS